MSQGSQGKRGIGCSLAKHEEPIDASHYVPPDPCQSGLANHRTKIPGRGHYVVILETPGETAVRVSKHKTPERAKSEASRLNAELRTMDKGQKKKPAFYYVMHHAGRLPWFAETQDTDVKRPRESKKVQERSRKTKAKAI